MRKARYRKGCCCAEHISGKVTEKLGRATGGPGWEAAFIFKVDLFFHLRVLQNKVFNAALDILVCVRWHIHYAFK